MKIGKTQKMLGVNKGHARHYVWKDHARLGFGQARSIGLDGKERLKIFLNRYLEKIKTRKDFPIPIRARCTC